MYLCEMEGGFFFSFSQLTIYSCEVAFVFLGGVLWAVVANIFWGKLCDRVGN